MGDYFSCINENLIKCTDSTNNDCPTGFTCNYLYGHCDKDCNSNNDCPSDHQCSGSMCQRIISNSCTSDGDCPVGRQCDDTNSVCIDTPDSESA